MSTDIENIIMQHYNFFETKIWIDRIDNIDNENLKKKILNFSREQKTINISNVGGYQGHEFYNEEWYKIICKKIPFREDKPIKNFIIDSWVNINGRGHYNNVHDHVCERIDPEETDIFLSGVYYVSVPENSGDIVFHDIRGPSRSKMLYHQYYLDGVTYNKIQPKKKMLIFFPPWLEHSVDVNMSDESRISIAFNVRFKNKPLNITNQKIDKIKNTFISYC